MAAEEEQAFLAMLRRDEEMRKKDAEMIGKKLVEADEYEVAKLY
jgi:hypothetical protein